MYVTRKKIIIFIISMFMVVSGWQFYKLTTKDRASTALIIYGNVDIRDVELSFRVSGRIAEMRFEEGDRVEQGEVVAILERDTFLEDLAIAKAELAEAESALVNANNTYERRAKLVKTGSVSEALYDDARFANDQAKARVATAKARVERSETALEDIQIKAPATGVILTRVREPGAVIQMSQPVYILAVDDLVWVRTYVTEPDLGRIYPGQKAIVTTDSGDTYQGQIGFISPQAEFTPKNVETKQLRTSLIYRLRIIVDTKDQRLRQGMPVTISIDMSTAKSSSTNK